MKNALRMSGELLAGGVVVGIGVGFGLTLFMTIAKLAGWLA